MAKGKNFGGFGGGMNMQAMMKQAQKMQENMHIIAESLSHVKQVLIDEGLVSESEG